eukprot:363801-Chlamydomonas_euryale.AAC.3
MCGTAPAAPAAATTGIGAPPTACGETNGPAASAATSSATTAAAIARLPWTGGSRTRVGLHARGRQDADSRHKHGAWRMLNIATLALHGDVAQEDAPCAT